MAGQESIRGYLLQTLIGLLGALAEEDRWLSVALEPGDQSDGVDIGVDILWNLPHGIKVVQVKSSQNQITVPKVKAWAKKLQRSRNTAIAYELVLIGPCSQGVIGLKKVGTVEIPLPRPLDVIGMCEQAAHRIDTFLQSMAMPPLTPDFRQRLVLELLSWLQIHETSGTTLFRHDLERFLVNAALSENAVRTPALHDGRLSCFGDFLLDGMKRQSTRDAGGLLPASDNRVPPSGACTPQQAWMASRRQPQPDYVMENLRTTASDLFGHADRSQFLAVCHCVETRLSDARTELSLADVFRFLVSVSSFLSRLRDHREWLLAETGRYEQFCLAMRSLTTLLKESIHERTLPPNIQAHFGTTDAGACHGVFTDVGGYSCLADLCVHLLLRSPDEVSVCINIGTDGYVSGCEFFARERAYMERKKRHPSPNTDRNSVFTRLLGFTVAGRVMTAPEFCFCHLTHTIAELTDWPKGASFHSVRTVLNTWVMDELLVALGDGAISCTYDPLRRMSSQPMIEQLYLPLLYSLASHSCRDTPVKTEADVSRRLSTLVDEHGPCDLIDYACEAVQEELGMSDFPNRYCQAMSSREPQLTVDIHERLVYLWTHIRGAELQNTVSNLRSFVSAITCDIAMWSALDYILSVETSTPRTGIERLDDLSVIFENLLLVARDIHGSAIRNKRLEHAIIHRWAIQAAGVSSRNGECPVWSEMILDRVDRLSVCCPNMPSRSEAQEWLEFSIRFHLQFSVDSGLVYGLGQFAPYGGSQPMGFPEYEGLPRAEQQLLKGIRDAWRADGVRKDEDRASLFRLLAGVFNAR